MYNVNLIIIIIICYKPLNFRANIEWIIIN